MESVTRFIEGRLKLEINAEKSAVARPWERSFLGFTVKSEPGFPRCIAAKAIVRLKDQIRELTERHRGVSLERLVGELNPPQGIGPATSASAHELLRLGISASMAFASIRCRKGP